MTLQVLVDQAKGLAASLCEDRCSIVDVSAVNDGYGGQTLLRTTILSDIPCMYEAGGDQAVEVAGTVITTTLHRIFMVLSTGTLAIKPDYEIVVAARGDKAALTFENPHLLADSYETLLTVSAKLKI